MSKGADTRRRVVDTAAGLFRRQGYHATGLNQILGAGQAPKGSLYFHFPGGKEQVAVEAVAASAAHLGERVRDALAGSADPGTGLTRVADLLAAQLVASGYLDGCPVAAIAHDAVGSSEPIRAACAGAYEGWLDVLATALRAWGVPAGHTGPLATVVLSSVEGALLLARVQRDTAPLYAVTDHLVQSVTAAAR
jgi:TetR/AcrR family transcriptional regulator, lmrAB and yxaGH operons repressor